MDEVIEEIDLRKIAIPIAPIRCRVNDLEFFEVRIEALAKYGKGGASRRLRVFHSVDGAETWEEVPLKLTWKARWDLMYNYVGGDRWPPCGEDVSAVSIADGRLTIEYSQLYLFSVHKMVTRWEAQYLAERNRWTIRFAGKF